MADRRLDDLAQVVRILERIRAEGTGVDDITACLKIAAVQRDDLIRMRQVPRFGQLAGLQSVRLQDRAHAAVKKHPCFPKRSVSFISLYLLKLQSVLPHSSQPLRWQSCFGRKTDDRRHRFDRREQTAFGHGETDLARCIEQTGKITLMLDRKIAVAGTEARTAVQPLLLRHVPQRIVHLIAAGLDHSRRHRLQDNSIAHADC